MADLVKPDFVEVDAEKIKAEIIADYETATNRKLSPGQAEMLILNALAYREQILRISINEASRQNLVAFARYPMLDYLGELVGVQRLPASKAECTLNFSLIEGHGAIHIPEGIRVQSTDGKVVFITLESKQALSTDTSVLIKAACTTEGEAGNNYKAGEIAIILDPQAFIASASNTAITAGGSDQESDELLRNRIKLAPSSFSNAGSRGAYEFFAKSAHPAIIDVGITSPIPGQVNIYPLLEGGVTPSDEIIDAVYAKCNADKVRPLTDTVVVEAPEIVNYVITVNLTLLTGAITEPTIENVRKNLQAYADYRKSKLGVDVVLSQLIANASVNGVYKVEVTSPLTDISVGLSKIAICNGITVNVTGVSDE